MATDAKLRRTMMESLGKSKSNSEATMSVVIESTKRQFVAKRVRFALEPVIYITWDLTYAADLRSGDIWMQEARDRDRFKRRIQTIETSLSPVLHHIHRDKIFTERFGF